MSARRTVVGGSVLAALAVALSSWGCSETPDPTRVTEVYTPDFTTFAGELATPKGPYGFLVNKCGTLDCHGQVGRPFRIFGRTGLRLQEDDGGGAYAGQPPSPSLYRAEARATFEAAVSLEPELTSVVVYEAADPERLLLVKKPLAIEGHKGGQVIAPGDPADRCLETWIIGATDEAACQEAAQ